MFTKKSDNGDFWDTLYTQGSTNSDCTITSSLFCFKVLVNVINFLLGKQLTGTNSWPSSWRRASRGRRRNGSRSSCRRCPLSHHKWHSVLLHSSPPHHSHLRNKSAVQSALRIKCAVSCMATRRHHQAFWHSRFAAPKFHKSQNHFFHQKQKSIIIKREVNTDIKNEFLPA